METTEMPKSMHALADDGVVMKARTLNLVGREFDGDMTEVLTACRCDVLDMRNAGTGTLGDLERCLAEYGQTLRPCRWEAPQGSGSGRNHPDLVHEQLIDGEWTPVRMPYRERKYWRGSRKGSKS
jgi:hypothetical protein